MSTGRLAGVSNDFLLEKGVCYVGPVQATNSWRRVFVESGSFDFASMVVAVVQWRWNWLPGREETKGCLFCLFTFLLKISPCSMSKGISWH